VVFQTIRESKALAYSTFASYNIPGKKEDPFTAMAYVGSQSDKMNDAVNGMNELLNELPPSSQRFDLAISAVKKDIQTQRIVKDGIIFSFLNAEKKGFDRDVRKDIYESLNNINLKDVEQLHKSDLADKPYTYCIVASDKKVKSDALAKIGEVKKLTLEEIFGY
jgi:predicted Zn-dependent peptidase